MRIISFTAENFKKLRIVEVRPKGHVTKITGRNGQGKTSVLDGFAALFEGKKSIPEKPVRRGAEKSKLTGVLSDEEGRPYLIATRKISGDRTTELTIEAAPGATRPAGTPQAILDGLIGAMSFDPVAFISLEPKKQVEMLRQVVKLDIDIEDLNTATRLDYAERTNVNRKVAELKVQAEAMIYSPGLPKDKVDEAVIVAKITEANDANRQIGARITEKNRLAKVVSAAEQAASLHVALLEEQARIVVAAKEEEEADKAMKSWASNTDDLIRPRLDAVPQITYNPGLDSAQNALEVLLSRLESLEKECDVRTVARVARWEDARKVLEAAHALTPEVEGSLDAARQAWQNAPEGEMVDTNPLLEELQRAQLTNREIDKWLLRQKLDEQVREAENEAAQLTRKMEDREEKKRLALAEAKMPLDGLTFNEQGVLFKGLPLEQLGEAEQIRVGCALAMAANPKLRCIPIARGESLDDEALEQIAQMAEENDFQVFMAMVDTSGKTGIVLEDGMVKTVNE
jgi:hypothetical protein